MVSRCSCERLLHVPCTRLAGCMHSCCKHDLHEQHRTCSMQVECMRPPVQCLQDTLTMAWAHLQRQGERHLAVLLHEAPAPCSIIGIVGLLLPGRSLLSVALLLLLVDRLGHRGVGIARAGRHVRVASECPVMLRPRS